ncbi:hypothetical protein AXG93_2520s1260 [Marchantia polymorpha subsp. ruderalis]|uniref:Vacuolar protein sorting-associated protein 35 n=1 Tax=Marchantia polymorpha subsp. ruderalis TaxID=1480154 RepID=A0A176W3K4_MARPO|nr:hypothetical protein AXG93_2520s1260 [Marchantia polymorpha subsp. ruderalis]
MQPQGEVMSSTEEQEKWLADAMALVQHHAFFMHRALARPFSSFAHALVLRSSRSLALLFNPRREGYLLCTVGSVYIKSKEAPAKDVLKDLVEMSRGVQHPIRGLFLRSYLSQISRDKLPDVGSEYEGEGGNVMDAVEFVLQNFTEMNKLWVRMQHQGPAREKEKREKERSELRDLVGKNLHVLSQLEGVDLEMYKEVVLPRVLEQVVNCKDDLAQYYLMDCIIQVFPDDFHLQTLETLLGACPQLQPNVDIKTVMSQLMERLSNYAASSPEVLPEFLQVEAFTKLSNSVVKVIEAQPEMSLVGAVSLHVALLTFILRVHIDRLDYVDQVLGACVKKLEGKGKVKDSKATKQIVALLSAPLEKYNDVVTMLKLVNYPKVMQHLDYETNKVMATVIIQSIMKNGTYITTADKVDALFELLKELIKDGEGAPSMDELDEEDFKEEQNLVARLVHMLVNPDPEEMFKILTTARKHFGQGGPKRLEFTLAPLIFSALKLVRSLQGQAADDDSPVSLKKVFQFLHQAASDCALEPVAYEFFTQAFMIYEEEIADSKAQVTAIHLIIGTLQRTQVFGVENRDTLTHKSTGYSAKLLKKPDQCRAVFACSHLFWVEAEHGIEDGERVLLCLKRALRIANAAQQMSSATRGSNGPMTLFVEILNKYLYYYEKGNPQVTSNVIQGLLELIQTEMQSENTAQDPGVDAFFANYKPDLVCVPNHFNLFLVALCSLRSSFTQDPEGVSVHTQSPLLGNIIVQPGSGTCPYVMALCEKHSAGHVLTGYSTG